MPSPTPSEFYDMLEKYGPNLRVQSVMQEEQTLLNIYTLYVDYLSGNRQKPERP